MIKRRSRVDISVVDEALELVGPISWPARLFGMKLRPRAARGYATIVLDEWHGARAAASLAHRSANRFTFVQGAELHAVGRSPEGKLAIAAANIAVDIESSTALSRPEITSELRKIVAAARAIHTRRTRWGHVPVVQINSLAAQVKRLAAIRDG